MAIWKYNKVIKNKISKWHKCNVTKTKQILLLFHFIDINFDTLYFSKVNIRLVNVEDAFYTYTKLII